MGQIIRKEIVGQLLRTSGTNVLLAQSVLNIGGQQYATQTNLLMDISTSGFGGLDTGTVAASTTYHLYAVVNNAGAVGLVTSLNLPIANGPVGFPNWKYLWSIHTDQSNLILDFQRVGKKNVFTDSLTGVKTSPSVANNNAALVIDTSGGVSPWPNGTSTSNNATFTSNMLNGLADEFEGVFFAVGDGGSTGFRARLYQDNTSQGNIAALGAFISVVGVLFTAPYVGTVGATYFIEMASSLAERDLVNKILSYDNKLVDESSSAGTIVNVGDFIPGPRSEVFMYGGNGHGSTDTFIRRFTTFVSVVGTDISVIDNAANGTYFRINSDGVYSIAYEDASSSGAAAGLTRNSPNLNTPVSDVSNDPYRLLSTSVSAAGANQPAAITTTLFLNQGDLIRAHNDSASTPNGTSNNGTTFRITKVANAPLATPVGPRSEIVVDTNASLGSAGGNQIVVWTNVQYSIGSDISVTQDSVNGWYFTINTDGIYGMSTDVTQTGIAHTGISRNQANLLTDITGIPAAQRLTDNTSHGDNGSSNHVPSATTRLLFAGDIIRVCAGTSIGGQANLTYFSIVKVSN